MAIMARAVIVTMVPLLLPLPLPYVSILVIISVLLLLCFPLVLLYKHIGIILVTRVVAMVGVIVNVGAFVVAWQW